MHFNIRKLQLYGIEYAVFGIISQIRNYDLVAVPLLPYRSHSIGLGCLYIIQDAINVQE